MNSLRMFFVIISLTCMPTILFAANITVVVENVERAKGRIQVALNDVAGYAEEGKQKPIGFSAADATSPQTTIVLTNIPTGRYAIRVRHDVNGNNKLDKNFLGIPKEPWGVSNDTGSFGLPKFEEAAFNVDEDATIHIELR